MSSSNSNAAARRRRAGPPPMQTNVRPPPGGGAVNAGYRPNSGPHMMNQQVSPQPGGPQNSVANQPQDNEMRAKPPMTPAQMLISHEQRLMEIESAFPDMVGKLTHEISREIENLKGTSGESDSGSKDSMSLLENRLDEIESTVSGLAKSYKLINDLVAEMNISLFKIMNSNQQTSQLEQQEPETVEVSAESEPVAETQEASQEVAVLANEEEPVAETQEASQEVAVLANEEEPAENVSTPAEENEVVAIKSGKKKGKR